MNIDPCNSGSLFNLMGPEYILPEPDRKPATSYGLSLPFAKNADGKVSQLALGFDWDGFDRNALLLGGTGVGKTNLLKAMIASALINYRPEDLSIWVEDCRGKDYDGFAKATDMVRVLYSSGPHDDHDISFLDELYGELERRLSILREKQEPNILWYWSRMRERDYPHLPRILLIVDELPVFCLREHKNRCRLENLFRASHAAGINCIFSGSYCNDSSLSWLFSFCNIRLFMKNFRNTGSISIPDISKEAAEKITEQISTLRQGEVILTNNGGVYGSVERLFVPKISI